MEMEDIANTVLCQESCMKAVLLSLYECLDKEEDHFHKILNVAQAENCKLKFVASFIEGKASVGLQHVDPA